MRIVYLPNRSSLAESIEDSRVFYDMEDMLKYIVLYHDNAFRKTDIYISYYTYDERIGSPEFIVTISKHGNIDYFKEYQHPQAIGYCIYGNTKSNIKRNFKTYFRRY